LISVGCSDIDFVGLDQKRVRQKFVEEQIKARDEETKALEEKARKLEEVLEMLKGQDALEEKTESIEEKNHKLEEELEILRRQYAPGPSSSSQDTPVTLAAS
jgi:DNA repair exonuclease SbcCD ATPase subunit